MVMVDTCVRVACLMVDNDELCIVTADLKITYVLSICCGPSSTVTIMTLKSVIVHPFFAASSNGRIDLTHTTSDSPICPTRLFQFNGTTSFKL
ncbi:hypothetical protein TNCV_1600611 [Trichonephila clavipes]|nr:hypothetical protein TNCV_1600611 [Trichonephila clavipes]